MTRFWLTLHRPEDDQPVVPTGFLFCPLSGKPCHCWLYYCPVPDLIFNFDRYPYLTPDLPGIGGSIRAEPAEFQVEEIPAYLPSGEGEHLMLHIEKEGLTTRQVFEFIKGPMHINEAHIGVAGLKDKHARTRQWISIPARYQNRVVQLEDIGVKVLESGLHLNKLRVGHLKGNRFRILVRGIEGDESRAHQVFEQLQRLGVPNYYGPQRFGIGGQNPVKGYELVTKGKGRNGAWLKRFLISSLQSLLFNDWLALRLERDLYGKVILGDIAKKHDSGGEFEVMDALVETPRAQRLEISATGALYGKKYREALGEARQMEDEILARYQLGREQFRARRGDRRMLRFPLTEWSVEAIPDGLWVSFVLPKGAYATAVLREVMKKNPEGVETGPDEGEDQSE